MPCAMSSSHQHPQSTPSEVPNDCILMGAPQSIPLSSVEGSSEQASNEDTMFTPHYSQSKLEKSIEPGPADGFPLRRFIVRTALLIVVPPLITAYFIVISWVYRAPDPERNPYGHRNALWVYYSWFVIGVFGLGISSYGLAGIEAAMLQDRHWHAKSALALLMHSGQSWSGPGGWLKFLGIFARTRNPPAQRLWWLLSFISLMITIALPISGLSFELFDGFVQAAYAPLVIGYSSDTFNSKNWYRANQQAPPFSFPARGLHTRHGVLIGVSTTTSRSVQTHFLKGKLSETSSSYPKPNTPSAVVPGASDCHTTAPLSGLRRSSRFYRKGTPSPSPCLGPGILSR
jgi:hypothetical protein